MAINSGRLVVDPVTETTRAKLRNTILRVSNTRPPAASVYVDPVEGLTAVTQSPLYKGQIQLFQDTATDRNILLVVVEFSTPNPSGGPDTVELIWKEVRTTWYYSDALTGEEFRAL
jgi:hypothetical protein